MSKQIAIKNLQGLNDILDAEKLTCKKIDAYMSIAKDEALINLLSSLQTASKAHYGAVYNYLKSHQA